MNYDIVIVGAGVAGLSAGYKISKTNNKYIILESSESSGGRASTRKHTQLNFDLGAGFVMGSYKNLFSIIKDLNIPVEKQKVFASHIAIEHNVILYKLNPDILSLSQFKLVAFTSKLRALFTSIIFVKDFLVTSKGIYGADQNLESYLKKVFGKSYVNYFINPLSNNLFLYKTNMFTKNTFFKLLHYVKSNTTYYNFPNGINQFSDSLSEHLNIQYNSSVKSIVKNSDKVDITYSQNNELKTITADKAIIAIPGDRILEILPNANASQKELLNNLSYSSTIKVLCSTQSNVFESFDRVFFSDNKNVASVNLINKIDDEYYFSVGINSDVAKKLMEKHISLNELKSLITEACPFIKDIKIHDLEMWSSALPKFTVEYANALSRYQGLVNHSDNIIFAGDFMYGPFIEGAVISGFQAAELCTTSETSFAGTKK